ncbi:glycosyltransferase family 39 protein [Candidatus Leptofilum sp.]|uniref:glycosyltransferase family 39 protein n=1 Tax=Candidatus Leptofilum sp. TaxID=3241576 RepID=UPI003B5ACF5C
MSQRRREFWLIVAITFVAFVLRLWQLGHLPPGWRDDELINSLVISQKVLNGDLAVYYPDASGHEALYHALNAIMLGLFGANWAGVRLLSAFLGTLAVPLTYKVGRQLFGRWVGITAAAGLTVSFWGLMYARFGLRHVLMPLLTLGAFYFFWQGFQKGDQRLEIRDFRGSLFNLRSPISNYLITAVFMSLGFYTYFAGRGVPLILLAFMGGVWLLARPYFYSHWRGWFVMLVGTAVLAIPLILTLQAQPEAEGRVAELAVPLVEARAGNFEPLQEYVITTLGMFHATGDGEWLYNIPNRPLFGVVGAIFFWGGVLLALVDSVRLLLGRLRRKAIDPTTQMRGLATIFLLLWWLAGIAPAFISVPPASLGHTILAQPVTYILAALPMGRLEIRDWRLSAQSLIPNLQSPLAILMGLLLVGSIAVRDLPDYFQRWPERGMVRFLYRADIQNVADYVNQTPEMTDFGVSGLLAGPWDRLALQIGLHNDDDVRPRWFNAERALLLSPPLSFVGFPDTAVSYEPLVNPVAPRITAGTYLLAQTEAQMLADPSNERICFMNGLCWLTAVYDSETNRLELGWQVGETLQLPPIPLISNPPPPGVYAGPRLQVFAQLLDAEGNFLTGDDGLWVDPVTLQPGDTFLQQHWLSLPEDAIGETAVFGLYDPMTGERILTTDGRDHLRLEIR